jgi:SAM-dependent methyltransferase
MKSGWIYPRCDLCGGIEGDDFLTLKHRDAPGGVAFIRRCQECGLKRLWPRPGDETLSRYYPSYYGAYIGRRRTPFKQALWDLLRDGASGAPGRGRNLWLLRSLFRLLADGAFDINVPLNKDPLPRIIDVGCGFGDLLLYWGSRGADALGVDLDERAVRMAEKLGLHVVQGTLKEQCFPSKSFDVAVFNHSLEHLPSPLADLEEAARLLRPGGMIYITVPNGASAGLELEKEAWDALCFPVHLWLFDVVSLERSLKAAGFGRVKVKTKNMWRHRVKKLKDTGGSHSVIMIWQLLKKSFLIEHSRDLICASAIL